MAKRTAGESPNRFVWTDGEIEITPAPLSMGCKPAKHNELDLDRFFWRAITTDSNFQRWFLRHTKFASFDLELVEGENWHHAWYKEPLTGIESETDILLVFRNRACGSRYALHIENKPGHGKWRKDQARRYRKRAEDRKEKLNYVEYETALIAPRSFISRCTKGELDCFDFHIPYEEISRFIPEFAPAITLGDDT